MDYWYLRISLRVPVPGLFRWDFSTPSVAGADLWAAFVTSCFRGALPPVDLLDVCFVGFHRAVFSYLKASVSCNESICSRHVTLQCFINGIIVAQ